VFKPVADCRISVITNITNEQENCHCDNKGKNFMKLLLSTVAAIAFAGAAYAAEVGGTVGAEFTKNLAGDFVATPTVELSFGHKAEGATAFGAVGVEAVNGNLVVDSWHVGVAFSGTSVSFGDQGDLFSFGGLEVVGGDTLADPADDHESVIVGHGAVEVLVGLTDISTNVGDIENVQIAYSNDYGKIDVTGAFDYNLNTEDTTVAVSTGVDVSEALYANVTVTYADAFAYEALGTYSAMDALDVSAFINGDEDDMAQNIGAGVVYTKDSLSAFAEVGYNLDTEETTPAVGVSFSF
jgi:hypothetical protein